MCTPSAALCGCVWRCRVATGCAVWDRRRAGVAAAHTDHAPSPAHAHVARPRRPLSGRVGVTRPGVLVLTVGQLSIFRNIHGARPITARNPQGFPLFPGTWWVRVVSIAERGVCEQRATGVPGRPITVPSGALALGLGVSDHSGTSSAVRAGTAARVPRPPTIPQCAPQLGRHDGAQSGESYSHHAPTSPTPHGGVMHRRPRVRGRSACVRSESCA